MTDTDAIVRDAKTAEAKAIIEFKHANIRAIDMASWEIRALRSDAKKLQVPLFVVVYYHLDKHGMPLSAHQYPVATSEEVVKVIDHRQYLVIAGNDSAKGYLGTTTRMMSAHEFFSLQATLSHTSLKGQLPTTIVDYVDLPSIQAC